MILAGVDEAGRGPLAGPVVAAAVILDPKRTIAGIADSKVLSAKKRELLESKIKAQSRSWCVAWADAAEVDSLNILGATMLAMHRAILGLTLLPSLVEVDGNRLPRLDVGQHTLPGRAVVQGDRTVPAISAASILAKVARDRMMYRIDQLYPGYGFAKHKGYGTREHRDRIQTLGPCLEHRRTFRPISALK